MSKEYGSKENSGAGEAGRGHVTEFVSAYIDGALSIADMARVRAHIAACPACRTDYIELKAAQRLLSRLPVEAPPRAFTLSEAMVSVKGKQGFWERVLAPALAPRLAFGSAMSFALLLLVFVTSYSARSESMATNNSAPLVPLANRAILQSPVSAASSSTPADAVAPAPMAMMGATPTTPDASAYTVGGGTPETQTSSGAGASNSSLPTAGMMGGSPMLGETPPAPAVAQDNSQAAATPTTHATTHTGATSLADVPPTTVGIAVSGNSSPTTTEARMYNKQPPTVSSTPGPSSDAYQPTSVSLAAQGQAGTAFPVAPVLEVGLAGLGVALALSAWLARRRGL